MSLELTAASTDRINHGTALGGWTVGSWGGWFYPTTLTDFASFLFLSSTGGFQAPSMSVRDTDDIGVGWRRASGGTNLLYQTNNAGLTTNKWWFIAVTIDQGAAANSKVKIYVGDLATLATERTYGTINEPLTYTDNTGGTFYVGDNSVDSACVGGRYGGLMVWPSVVLTLAQIQAMQFHFRPLVAGCKLFAHYGLTADASSTQPDFSGSGNTGAPTGAALAAHVPLGPLFGYDEDESYVVSGGGGGGRIFKLAGQGGGLAGPMRGLVAAPTFKECLRYGRRAA
jgi:hypothetical protein